MRSRSTTLLIALGVGVLLTLMLTAAAYYTYETGAESIVRILSWPNTLLQNLIPCHDIGTAERPFCEGTPLNVAAYVASFSLSVAVYTTIAYVLLRRQAIASNNPLERTREG
jgi:hypothetical protein